MIDYPSIPLRARRHAWLAALLIPCAATAANLVPNGDFSAPLETPGGWTERYDGRGRLTASLDPLTFASPPSALRIESTGDAVESNIGANLPLPLAHRALQVRGDLRFQGSGTLQVALITNNAAGDAFLWQPFHVVAGPTEWTSFTSRVTVPADTAMARVVFHLVGEGQGWLDDLVIEPEDGAVSPAITESLRRGIRNGMMAPSGKADDPTPAHWESWAGKGKIHVERDPLVVPPGVDGALRVESVGGPVDATVATDLLPAAVGVPVRVSGWVKHEGFDEVNVVAAVFDESGKVTQWSIIGQAGGSSWARFDQTVISRADGKSHRLILQVKGSGRAWFADVVVTPLAERAPAAPAAQTAQPVIPTTSSLARGESTGPAGPALPADPTPEGGLPLLGPAALFAPDLVGANAQFVRGERIAIEAQPFTEGIRITTVRKPEQAWHVQAQFFLEKPVARGDILLASFAARGTGTVGRQPMMEPILGQFGAPWRTFSTLAVSPTHEWRRYHLRAIAAEDYPAGQARLTFNLGHAPQTIELADLRVVNYRQGVDYDSLPATRVTYEGRAADAPWRAEAKARIAEHRQADLVVEVRDPEGRPVPNTPVRITQTSSAFALGTCVSAYRLTEASEDGERYRNIVERHFSDVTIEWETMWDNWVKPNTRDAVLKAVAWLRARGKTVHGCHIHWGGEGNLPPELRSFSLPPEDIRNRMRTHTEDKLNALRGFVSEWNVVNEVWSEPKLWRYVGMDEIDHTFRQARALDPSLVLGINDHGDFASWNEEHIEGYLRLIGELLARGVRIDVIGLQGHFGTAVRSPTEVLAILDRFAQFGLPIHVSELDINCADEEFQADFLRDIHIALFSHPSVVRVTQWGFWEATHWLPTAALWRKDWTEKPAARAWLQLVEKDWRTDVTVRTDADGRASVRGFKGAYTVSAIVAGRPLEATVSLDKPARVTLR